MRHGNMGRALSRTSAHRQALLHNVVTSLLRHEAIRTTIPKAKEARRLAEKVITLGKRGTPHARRQAFRTVRDPEVIDKLFDGLAGRYAKRPGGYTRITRLGRRLGDAAEMALLELVDRPLGGGEPAEEPEGKPAKGKKPEKSAKTAEEPKAKKAKGKEPREEAPKKSKKKD